MFDVKKCFCSLFYALPGCKNRVLLFLTESMIIIKQHHFYFLFTLQCRAAEQ